MPINIAPYAVEAAAEVAKFAVKEWISNRARVIEAPSVRVLPPEPAPSVGCPYCAIGKHLAATYLYLNRMAVRPAMAAVYAELARDQVDDALLVARGLPESLQHAELERTIRGYAEGFAAGIDSEAAGGWSRKVWNTANIAMRMAEQRQETPKGAKNGPA